MLTIRVPHLKDPMREHAEAVLDDKGVWRTPSEYVSALRMLLRDTELFTPSLTYFPTRESRLHAAFLAMGVQVVDYQPLEQDWPEDRVY
jgi:hypothetical protein